MTKQKIMHTGETTLGDETCTHLRAGMLELADRNFFSYEGWKKASATGAALVWRVKRAWFCRV